MILTLGLLIVLVQTPVWLLLIFLPESRLTRQATSNYGVFVLLGVLFIFLVVAALVYALSFNSSVINALASVPTDSAQINAETMKPVLDALRLSANVQTTIFGLLLATTVLDLAGGLLAFRDMAALGVQRGTRSLILLIMFLLGPVGMLVYGTWHYLNKNRPAASVE